MQKVIMQKHTHAHTHMDIQGFRGGALGECVFFIRGESYNHYFLRSIFLTNSSKCSPDPEKPEFGVFA